MKDVLFILAELDDADLEWLADVGEVRRVPEGEVLIPRGVPNHFIYVVLDGELAVLVDAGGPEIVRLGAGELVGEISLLDSRPPQVTVAAAGPAKIFVVGHDTMRTKMERDPSFAAHFYRAISIFLANRLERQTSKANVGAAPRLEEHEQDHGELSPELMDSVSLAGHRFLAFLEKLKQRA